MATSSPEREALLKTIAERPVEDQVNFAHGHPGAEAPLERSTWDALYGIASNGQEPPTDEQVAQWLDEHRMEKYGG